MNLNEIDALYALVQIGDNRRDADTVTLNEWAILLKDCRHYHLAMEAVRKHRRDKPGVWIEPGHIAANYRLLARQILERADQQVPLTPPDEVARWLEEYRENRQAALADPAALAALEGPTQPERPDPRLLRAIAPVGKMPRG